VGMISVWTALVLSPNLTTAQVVVHQNQSGRRSCAIKIANLLTGAKMRTRWPSKTPGPRIEPYPGLHENSPRIYALGSSTVGTFQISLSWLKSGSVKYLA